MGYTGQVARLARVVSDSHAAGTYEQCSQWFDGYQHHGRVMAESEVAKGGCN